jgi:hypothetical protein
MILINIRRACFAPPNVGAGCAILNGIAAAGRRGGLRLAGGDSGNRRPPEPIVGDCSSLVAQISIEQDRGECSDAVRSAIARGIIARLARDAAAAYNGPRNAKRRDKG